MKLPLFLVRHVVSVTAISLAIIVLPIILTTVVGHVPVRALMLGYWKPALIGIAPAATFLILPAAVGLGVVWSYGSLAAEGIVAVIYSARVSVAALCAPALSVACAVALLGYALSMWIAPLSSRQIHDTIFTIQNSLDPRLLEETRFYDIADGRASMSFERWIGPWEVSKMFVKERRTDGTERHIFADRAEFIKRDDELLVLLKKGRIHEMIRGEKAASSVEFNQFAQPLGMHGSTKIAKREWRGVYELDMREFIAKHGDTVAGSQERRHWTSEAIKRFIVPLMAVTHSLIALGLVLALGPVTGRRGARNAMLALSIVGVHTGGISIAEFLSTLTDMAPVLMVILLAIEAAVGGILLARQHFGPDRVRLSRLWATPAV